MVILHFYPIAWDRTRRFCQQLCPCEQQTVLQIVLTMKHCCLYVRNTKTEDVGYNTRQVQLVLLGILLLFCINGIRNEVETNQKHKPCKLIMWGLWQRDGKEVPEHPDGDDHDVEKDKKSLSEVNKQKEEKEEE